MQNILTYFRKSLSTKLSLSILLLAISIFVATLGLLFVKSRDIIRQEAMHRAASTLNTTMQRMNRYLQTVETATNSNDWLIAENLNPDSLLTISRNIVLLNANVDGCSISAKPDLFPKYGRYFSAYTIRENDTLTTAIEQPYNYFDKIWYKVPYELGKPCWVSYFDEVDSLDLVLQGRLASFGKPLHDAEHRFLGIISTDMSLQRLSAVIATEHPYPNSYFMMLGEDGSYLAHPDSTQLFTSTIFTDVDPKYHPDIVALGHEMTTGKTGTMKVQLNDKPCLVCYQPVTGTPWSLALVCPEHDILKSYHRLANIVIPVIAIGLLLILILCYRAVKHAIRPLNQLLNQSQRITAGQYDEQIPHTRRRDAVGRLQNSFATMQESLARHLTDIQEANAETERRNEELLHASQLAEEAARQKTAFIQNMTHQIRTPLNIIMGFAQVLRDSQNQLPEEEVRSITDMIGHNTQSLSRMVLMLFDSSDSGLSEELNSHKQEVVPCNDVARESIDHTHQHFPDLPIHFHTTLPDSFCIHTSRLYLMRSLRELLYNAAKYSDGQNVSLHLSATDTTVRFVFQDTGPGMDHTYHDLMFQPFTKVNDLSEGLGLGLPLAKRHIRNLGGDLTLDPTYPLGCRFIIELPNQ